MEATQKTIKSFVNKTWHKSLTSALLSLGESWQRQARQLLPTDAAAVVGGGAGKENSPKYFSAAFNFSSLMFRRTPICQEIFPVK